MMSDVDEEFRLAAALLVPDLLHDLAFHAEELPRVLAKSAILGNLLTSLERTEHLCWTIARELDGLPGEKRVYAAAWADDTKTATVSVEIDDTEPVHRALTRFTQCALNDDRETGAAVFATVPHEDLELFGRMLMWNVSRIIRAHQPSGCRR